MINFGWRNTAGLAKPVTVLGWIFAVPLIFVTIVGAGPMAFAQIKPAPPASEKSEPEKPAPADRPVTKKAPTENQNGYAPEGSMTASRLSEIITRLDPKAKQPNPATWQFTISERPVIVITDVLHNRMRIVSPIANVAGLPKDAWQRMMQANFDTALDARYAVARGVVWATFIHPLKELHPRQFISAIGQTVNLVLTFGKTFSSGAMSFGGGDSGELLRKKLLEDLQKKGIPI